MNLDQLIILSIKILSIGSIIQALEYLLTVRDPAFSGLNDWAVIKTVKRSTTSSSFLKITDRIFSNHSFIILNSAILLSATIILLTKYYSIFKWIILIIIICRMCLTYRKRIDSSAADQMQVILYIGCGIYLFADNQVLKHGVVWFISMEFILFYVAAGIFKVKSLKWRNNSALTGLFRTESYSTQLVYKISRRYHWMTPLATWSIFIFECFMPVCVFLGPVPCLIFIACGLIFHTMNVFIMGLNDFFWVFPASYPLLYWISVDIQQMIPTFLTSLSYK